MNEKRHCVNCQQEFDLPNGSVCPNDGGMLVPIAKDPLVGTLLDNRYEILEVLGGGGMGLVYKARHNLMKRIVAIKMLHKQFVGTGDALKRFQQEAQASSCLSLPNILTVYDFGLTPDGQPYMVMDYLDGYSLSDLLAKEGHLPVERSINIFVQACTALAHAHEKGVLHRDLKPSNIMLVNFENQKDFVKIVDFGIAKLLTRQGADAEQLTKTGEVFGSPLYMSPEQCRGKVLDARSDIYSVGCVMYKTLSGAPVFSGEELIELLFKQMSDAPAPFSEICPELKIPSELEEIVFKALAKEPENRYQSMNELRGVLRQLQKKISNTAEATLPPIMEGLRQNAFMEALQVVAASGSGEPPLNLAEASQTHIPEIPAEPVAVLTGHAAPSVEAISRRAPFPETSSGPSSESPNLKVIIGVVGAVALVIVGAFMLFQNMQSANRNSVDHSVVSVGQPPGNVPNKMPTLQTPVESNKAFVPELPLADSNKTPAPQTLAGPIKAAAPQALTVPIKAAVPPALLEPIKTAATHKPEVTPPRRARHVAVEHRQAPTEVHHRHAYSTYGYAY
jgi:eukaryotic-like serine/threonine-protein kinase